MKGLRFASSEPVERSSRYGVKPCIKSRWRDCHESFGNLRNRAGAFAILGYLSFVSDLRYIKKMKKAKHEVFGYPLSRIGTLDLGQIGLRKHHVVGLLEVDVVRRQRIWTSALIF
jgi:hypothetical protein